ncbi:MAG: S-layer homology domain-containing protein [Clostridia bacterium]|nr:S-layer homology domain-containing protein [Clostridia bacterium]
MKGFFKRIACACLAAITVMCIIPFAAVNVNAANAIKLSVPFFCQRSPDVCVNACLSMVEGYYYGYGQNNDYVYNTVMNYNPGAALSSSNSAKLGYTSIECTLQSVYDQLAAGKPVIIQRSGHFGVVYGYTPTESVLKAKDFLVLNPFRTTSGATVVGPEHYDKMGYSNMADWLSGNTWKTSWVKTANKIPLVKASSAITFSFNANGGSGSMSSINVAPKGSLTIPACNFTRQGYKCTGYYAYRSDGKWYTNNGWQTADAISSNGYTKKLYTVGTSYTINDSWTSGVSSPSFTMYTVWTGATYGVRAYENHSGKNYLIDSAFTKALDADHWKSRNTSVATIAIDSSVKHDSNYNTLKIVNASAGKSGNDLAFRTATNTSDPSDNGIGDNKSMTLSFWAKSSKTGSKMYFRWGYESNYRSVTLSTEWKKYTVKMDKVKSYGSFIHPYVDSAGTVWLSELQLEDGSSATAFVNETGTCKTSTHTYTKTYGELHTPVRDGYSFDGWYTAPNAGTRITSSTSVMHYSITVYAHWSKGHTHSYTSAVTKQPTCSAEGTRTYTCSCGYSYTESIKATGHTAGDWVEVKAPTETTEGLCEQRCKVCNVVLASQTIPVIGQEFVNVFVDVKGGAWYYDSVIYAVSNGYMNGMSKTVFSPNSNITREQFVLILANMAGVNTDEYKTVESGFDDVPTGQWYSGAVAWSVKSGYVSGLSKTRFGRGQSIQRGALARLLFVYAEKNGINTSGRADLSGFGDAAELDKSGNLWMKEPVEWAVKSGIISGMNVNGVNCINPKGTATRAQVARMLMAFDSFCEK